AAGELVASSPFTFGSAPAIDNVTDAPITGSVAFRAGPSPPPSVQPTPTCADTASVWVTASVKAPAAPPKLPGFFATMTSRLCPPGLTKVPFDQYWQGGASSLHATSVITPQPSWNTASMESNDANPLSNGHSEAVTVRSQAAGFVYRYQRSCETAA